MTAHPQGHGHLCGAPLVDVVMVTFNSRELTLHALERLLAGSAEVGLRLLVLDNGSTDATAQSVRERFPGAVVVSSEANLGFAAGVNRLLPLVRAPYVLLLNSDAWPRPGALALLVASARRAGAGTAALAPRIERPDGTVEHAALPFPSLRLAALLAVAGHRWLPRRWLRRWLVPPAWAQDQPRRVDWAHGAALLIPSSAWAAVGTLDERYFMYAEELDWFWRARDAGLVTWFEPAAVFVHLGGQSAQASFGVQLETRRAVNGQLAFQRRFGRRRGVCFALLNLAAAAAPSRGARRSAGPAGGRRVAPVAQLAALRVALRGEASQSAAVAAPRLDRT